MRALLTIIIFLSLQPFAYTADWYQIGLDLYGEAAGDGSGWSVSLSADGAMMAVGAPGNDSNGTGSGQARIYQNESGVWAQVGSDIGGESAGDRSGDSVSLSADGSVVAIGAPFNDGNGEDSGHVRVYRNLSGEWTQVGSDIDGEAEGDFSGYSVSLSADGSVVVIGAPSLWLEFSGKEPESGYTLVYRNLDGEWTQAGSDIDGEAPGDASGVSVSLSADGSVVAIGAFSEVPSGRVRSFISSDSATEPPIIRTPNWSQSSGFSATLRGQPESYYRIQWSINLIDWIDFASFVSESIETPFEDPEIEETDTRFYRAVSP